MLERRLFAGIFSEVTNRLMSKSNGGAEAMMADGERKKEYERKKGCVEERFRAKDWSDSRMVRELIRLIRQNEKEREES